MVNSRVKEERTVSFPQRHKLLFSTSQPNNRPITDSPEEPSVLPWRQNLNCSQLHSCVNYCIEFKNSAPHLLLAPLYACGPSCSSVSWCSCARMKRFQLWIRCPRRAFPVCSSESARIKPKAEASGIVRKARRKLLACKENKQVLCVCAYAILSWGWILTELKVLVYLAGVSSAQVQHVKKESQLTGQTELLLTQMILYQAPDWLQEVQHLPQHTQN